MFYAPHLSRTSARRPRTLAWVALASLTLGGGAEAIAGTDAVAVDGLDPWDSARWLVQTQLIMPQPIVLSAPDAGAVAVDAVHLAYIIGCEHSDGGTRRRVVVDCMVQDASIQASPWGRVPPISAAPVFALRDRLMGLPLRLRVHADGSLRSVTLDSAHTAPLRAAKVEEDVRELILLGLAGFDLRTPGALREGASWRARRSRIVRPPSLQHVGFITDPGDGGAVRGFEFEFGIRRDGVRPIPWDLQEMPQGEVAQAHHGKVHDDAEPGALVSRRPPAFLVYENGKAPSDHAHRASRSPLRPIGFLDLAPPSLFQIRITERVDRDDDGLQVTSTYHGGSDASRGTRARSRVGVAVARFDAPTHTLSDRVWAIAFPARGPNTSYGLSARLLGVTGRIQRIDPNLPTPEVGPSGFVRSPLSVADTGYVPWPELR